jgi:hypothetical protein
MKTPHDVTIYHKSVVNSAESWSRAQVKGVLWEDRKAANVLRSGLLEADRVAVYIPLARGELSIKGGDVLVKGLVGDAISGSFTISDLKRKYADVATVRSVDRMDYGSPALQHYQIGAS